MLLLLCCAQLCLTFCNAMDCSLPGSSVHGMLQAKILEWVAISSSRGSSSLRDRTCIFCVSCTGRWILYHCATREALDMLNEKKNRQRKRPKESSELSIYFRFEWTNTGIPKFLPGIYASNGCSATNRLFSGLPHNGPFIMMLHCLTQFGN